MLYRFMAIARLPTSCLLFTTQLKTSVVKRIARPTLILPTSTHSFHSNSINYFASSHDWNGTEVPDHPIIAQLKQHPHIIQQLVDFTSLLQAKGVDVSDKKPSFMQVMKVMNDPEIKGKVQQLAQDMQAAGIHLDMNTIQELQTNFAAMVKDTENAPSQTLDEKKDYEVEEQPQVGRKRGVMNRMKGLFKK